MVKANSFLILSLFILLSISPLVSSASLSMKESYEPQETMLVSLEGNILEPISLEQVQIKNNNVDIITEFDVKKIQDTYYIWALAPQESGNYTLEVKDAYATVLGKPQRMDILKNFTVAGNTTLYYIKPGFLSTSNDFKIEVQLNSDLNEIIDVNFPRSQSFIILPGKNVIPFSISSVNHSQLFNLQIGKYTIPIYFQVNKTLETKILKSVKFIPRIIQDRATYQKSYEIQILNSGDKINNLTIEYDSRLFRLNREFVSELDNGDVFSFNLSIINTSIQFISGNIVARYDNLSTMLPFEISFSDSNQTIKNNISVNLFKCAELPGTICKSNEICSGSTLSSLDGPCCTKTCESQSSGFNYSYLGYGLGLIVLIIAALLAGRYFKAKPNKTILEQETTKNQEQLKKK